MADIIYWCIYPDGSTPDPTASEIVGETYASATAYGNDTGPGVTAADFTGAAIAGSYSGDYRIAAVWSDGTNYSNVAISGVVSVGGAYDETFSASASGAFTLSDSWALNYAETFGASAASGATFTDTYDTPSVNYDETFAASAASGAELTDAWSLDTARHSQRLPQVARL